MDPLTAIRPFASPGLAPNLLSQAGALTGAGSIPLNELQELTNPLIAQPGANVTAAQPGSFGDLLGRMVNEVNAKQAAAGSAVQGLMSGEGVPLHQAVIAMEEAGVSFQLMVEVRNKLVESYQELMRMQV